MATKYLGEQFDIHTAAVDLIFPHHEDEIAQSRGVSGKEPVKVWMHGEFLNFNYRSPNADKDGESEDEIIKMSRSKGNIVLLRDIKAAGFDPMAYRYLLLTAHYRSKLNFSNESLVAAQNGLNNLRADLAALPIESADAASGWSVEAQQVRDAFHTAINDDLDLPIALSITREVARNNKIAPAERRRLLLDFDRVLGLRLDTVEATRPTVITDEALALVRERDAARSARDWKRSDQLRDRLIALGYEVRDTPRGTELV